MKWNMIRAKNTSITWYKHSISTILQHPRAQSDGGSRRRTGHHSAAQPKLWSHTGMLSVLRAVLGLRSLIQKKRNCFLSAIHAVVSQMNFYCNLDIKRQVSVINSTAKDSNDVTQKDAHLSKQQIWNYKSIHTIKLFCFMEITLKKGIFHLFCILLTLL